MTHPRSISLTASLAGFLATGLLPFGLALNAAGCGGSSGGGGSVGQVTNAINVSPQDGTTLSFGIQNRFYRQTVTVVGGGQAPYRFSNVNNALPAGLFLLTTRSDGSVITTATQTDIVGFPTSAGATQATFQILDAANDRTDPFYTFTINPRPGSGPLNMLPASGSVLASAQANTAYITTLNAFNGTAPHNWRIVFGGLPPGLSLIQNPLGTNTGQVEVRGTPTQTGTWLFAIEVEDSENPSRANGGVYQINVQ